MPNEQLLFSTRQAEPLAGGHSLCAGCAASIIVRQVIMSTEHPVVVANATGCLEVCTGIYPNSSWNVSWIHNAFANAAATLSGVETAYRALRKRGEIPGSGDQVCGLRRRRRHLRYRFAKPLRDVGAGARSRLRLLRQWRLYEHRRAALQRHAVWGRTPPPARSALCRPARRNRAKI